MPPRNHPKVYGNNVEIQAFAEMYDRPIHVYSYSTEPINIFQGSYNTYMPPILLSYHHGNHYNSLVDPRRLTVGAGLGFSCLRGANIDKDQVKAAIKAQQDQQLDNNKMQAMSFSSGVLRQITAMLFGWLKILVVLLICKVHVA
ncbi:OVARIAN TUMOR DOMAIN-containing deubiquitinating enzyme 6 isoform X1 [Elaeis guineensis]|uniref:OVARIAN TUMOR DOMAIN-containing deubiquitinating enzyme 6 isoform X1 n=1 Tax=Elaeis guineensis var. tenera TaxID=51953 RepID=UPI003C6D6711